MLSKISFLLLFSIVLTCVGCGGDAGIDRDEAGLQAIEQDQEEFSRQMEAEFE